MPSNWITGREIILAYKAAASWRTAVSVNTAGVGVLVTSESIGAKAPKFAVDESLGRDDVADVVRMNESVQGGSFQGYLRFGDMDRLIASVLGNASTPNSGGTLTRSATLSLSSNIDGIFGTLAMKKAGTSNGIWEIPSAKVHGMTISGKIGEFATIQFRMMGNKIVTVAGSITNTSLAAVTYLGSPICKMDKRFYIRANSRAASGLSSANAIHPSEFELTYDRPFAENWEASYDDMSEPVQNGFGDGKLKLTFDKYNIDTFMDALDINGTNDFKMEMFFQSKESTEASGTKKKYEMKIQMPHVVTLTGQADASGPGVMPHVVEFKVMQASATPTGMLNTDPLTFILKNKNTANALA